MKLFIFILFLAALFQSSFIPVNLCLIILIARSFALQDKYTFYLALFAGIFIGIFSSVNIGFWPLIFLTVVFVTHLTRKLPVTTNILTIIPVSLIMVLFVTFIQSLIFAQKINFWPVVWETALTLPIFILIKIWEERFVPRSQIKLKLKA